jgi:hypothetical protein
LLPKQPLKLGVLESPVFARSGVLKTAILMQV